jgi:uncharacterized protein YdhG (YjbR/CyaY superfamily)
MKKPSKTQNNKTRCPLTSSPRLRLASDEQTAAIKDNFPAGIAQPALRALFAAGLTTLEQLSDVTAEQLAELHGMGPKAIKTLRAGLNQRGMDFKTNQPKVSDQSVPSATSDVDRYIAQFSPDVQQILQKIRTIARNAAPSAEEIISYRMPAFRLHGILIYFAAFKHHIGMYPPISGDKAIEKLIAPYAGPKGNLQFPLDQPIPYKLIERIVKLRVKQDTEKAQAQRRVRR